MPAFQAEPGMPYWIDLTSSDVRKSSHFYSQVLGWEIEEISEGYRMARLQGLPVAGLVQRPEAENQPDTWVTYFSPTISTMIANVWSNWGVGCWWLRLKYGWGSWRCWLIPPVACLA